MLKHSNKYISVNPNIDHSDNLQFLEINHGNNIKRYLYPVGLALILAVGLIFSVYLVRYSQDIRSRASDIKAEQLEYYQNFHQLDIPLAFTSKTFLKEFENKYLPPLFANTSTPKQNIPMSKTENVTATITSPETQDYYKTQTSLNITGIANATNFVKYTLNAYLSDNPKRIIKIIESFHPVANEESLAVWNTPINSGKWTIQLTVFYREGINIQRLFDQHEIYLDSNLRQGWPVKIKDTTNFSYYLSNPIVSDLRFDGDVDIIYNFRNNLYTYSNIGRLLWQKRIMGDDNTINFYQPAIADIDQGYPGKEIVQYVKNVNINGKLTTGLMAWHADGTDVPGWPTEYLGEAYAVNSSFGPTIIKSSANDNGPFVIAENEWNTNSTKLFNSKGVLIKQIFSTQPYKPFGNISAGDINGDGIEDLIIHESQNGKGEVLNAYDLSGNPLWPSPIPFYGVNQYANYTLADMNHDGKSEVILAQCSVGTPFYCYVYMYNDKGQMLPGWNPKDISSKASGCPKLSIADINSNNSLNIIIAFRSSQQYWAYDYHIVLDNQGNELPGFPKPPDNLQIKTTFFDTIIGGGIFLKTIFIPSISQEYSDNVNKTILAYHQYDGVLTQVSNFPKELCADSGDCFMTSGAVAIINTSKFKGSIITGKYQHKALHLLMFDLGISNKIDEEWPQTRQNSRRTNSYPIR